MTPYISLTEAADRVLVSPEWFIANVVIDLPSPISINGETSWLRSDVDDWKTRCDAARDGALDELAALDQGHGWGSLHQENWRINSWNGQRMPKYGDWNPPYFDGFFYCSSNASTLI